MKCNHFQNSFSNYMDGTMAPDMIRKINEHLSGCAECVAFLKELRHSYTIIEQEKIIAANPFLYTRVMAQIETLEQAQANVIPVYLQWLQPAFVTMAMAGALILGIMLGNLYNTPKVANRVPDEMGFMNDAAFESLSIITQ